MCPRKVTNVPFKKNMLEAAVKAVQSGDVNAKKAACLYDVPVATISSHLKKRGSTSRKRREPVDLEKVDGELKEWLHLMADMGCHSLKLQIVDIVGEVFDRLGFKDKPTGKQGQLQWVDGFISRHPDLPKNLVEAESTSTGISSEHIDEWTQKLKDRLMGTYKVPVDDFTQESNAGQIFCCFEVGSVFRSKGRKMPSFVYKSSQGPGDGELMLSLYCCICADGSFLKPVALVKDENIVQTTMETGVKDFHILCSKKGKMNCEAAMLWVQLIDVEIQPKKGIKPFLIYLDQAIRPLSLATLDFCRQRQLILFYLPGFYPNMKLPFGMEIFYNLNGEYERILASDDAKLYEISVEGTLNLLMEAWKLMITTDSSITEFHDFGLVPFDKAAMKSTVEAIVPLTMSPTEGAPESQDAARTPGSSAHIPLTPQLLDASSSSFVPNTTMQSPLLAASPGSSVRPTRIPPKNYKESSDTEQSSEEVTETSNSSKNCKTLPESAVKKPNIKIKIKRSERLPNNFRVEQDVETTDPVANNAADVNDAVNLNITESKCDQCNEALDNGRRSGVVQGLVFALKRIESSLRADTLSLFKSRYLSPYLSDHRPTEPSFVMWCEIMKCLEMGPDAVQQDLLLAQSLHHQQCQYISPSNDFSTNRSLNKIANEEGSNFPRSIKLSEAHNSMNQNRTRLSNQTSGALLDGSLRSFGGIPEQKRNSKENESIGKECLINPNLIKTEFSNNSVANSVGADNGENITHLPISYPYRHSAATHSMNAYQHSSHFGISASHEKSTHESHSGIHPERQSSQCFSDPRFGLPQPIQPFTLQGQGTSVQPGMESKFSKNTRYDLDMTQDTVGFEPCSSMQFHEIQHAQERKNEAQPKMQLPSGGHLQHMEGLPALPLSATRSVEAAASQHREQQTLEHFQQQSQISHKDLPPMHMLRNNQLSQEQHQQQKQQLHCQQYSRMSDNQQNLHQQLSLQAPAQRSGSREVRLDGVDAVNIGQPHHRGNVNRDIGSNVVSKQNTLYDSSFQPTDALANNFIPPGNLTSTPKPFHGQQNRSTPQSHIRTPDNLNDQDMNMDYFNRGHWNNNRLPQTNMPSHGLSSSSQFLAHSSESDQENAARHNSRQLYPYQQPRSYQQPKPNMQRTLEYSRRGSNNFPDNQSFKREPDHTRYNQYVPPYQGYIPGYHTAEMVNEPTFETNSTNHSSTGNSFNGTTNIAQFPGNPSSMSRNYFPADHSHRSSEPSSRVPNVNPYSSSNAGFAPAQCSSYSSSSSYHGIPPAVAGQTSSATAAPGAAHASRATGVSAGTGNVTSGNQANSKPEA